MVSDGYHFDAVFIALNLQIRQAVEQHGLKALDINVVRRTKPGNNDCHNLHLECCFLVN